MKTKKIILFTALIGVLLSGCYVSSIHPLYTKKDRILVPEIEGKWKANDKETYIFEKVKDGPSYILTFITERQKGEVNPGIDTAIMKANFVRLGGEIFMDLYAGDNSHIDNMSEMLMIHLISIHTFAKIKIVDGTPQIHYANGAWLENLIENNQIRIKHEVTDERVILTASTKELQKFMTKYAHEEKAFEKPEILTAVQ